MTLLSISPRGVGGFSVEPQRLMVKKISPMNISQLISILLVVASRKLLYSYGTWSFSSMIDLSMVIFQLAKSMKVLDYQRPYYSMDWFTGISHI